MAKTTKRAERLVSALAKLHRLEELKKIELQRQLDALRQSEADVIQVLNRDNALQGLFMDTTSRFLRSLAREAERVSEAQDHQSKALFEHAGKLRRAEKLRDRISQRNLQLEDEKQLADVIERYGAKGPTSLP
jgi:phage gp16-like protein